MKTIDTLIAEDACRVLVLKGAEAVDAGDAVGFAALFTPDGVLVRPDTSGGVSRYLAADGRWLAHSKPPCTLHSLP